MAELRGVLALSDGSIYYGQGFGVEKTVVGELVFHTTMVGYQQALTDPSYAGQILTFAYPLIGNYGVNLDDFESEDIHVEGFIARETCPAPVHYKMRETIESFANRFGIPGLTGVDTRSIIRKIRDHGVMPACLKTYPRGDEPDVNKLIEEAKVFNYSEHNFIEEVSTTEKKVEGKGGKKVVLIDCGIKKSITRELLRRGVSVTTVNYKTSAEDIMAENPNGIIVSNGPGDPELHPQLVQTIKTLYTKYPLMGICFGHQILGLAAGGKTFKLKFGHRSANQPVKDLEKGLVYITSQNHGYAVDEKTLPKDFKAFQRNANDGTVEAIKHVELPVFSVQYHPEANPGPLDTNFLFDDFVKTL